MTVVLRGGLTLTLRSVSDGEVLAVGLWVMDRNINR